MNLTEEQSHAVDLACTGESVLIRALAGTGKTTTLAAIAEAMPDRRGLYLAFNKSIATEAQGRFPPTTDCRTAHSLAFREVGYAWGQRLGRTTGRMVSDAVGFRPKALPGAFTPSGIGYLLLGWVRNFCNSSDPELSLEHAPVGHLAGLDAEKRAEMIATLLPAAQALWGLQSDPSGSFPASHDVYLKIWALSRPRVAVDYVLFDEAQDANGVLLSVLAGCEAQVVWTGDRHQSIYQWRGAVNAMDKVDAVHRCGLTHSWRFGPEIADVANAVLGFHLGSDVGLVGRGAPGAVGRVSQPRAVLCRTNAKVVGGVIGAIERGVRATVVGGIDEPLRLINGILALRMGQRPDVVDLMAFSDYNELVAYVESDEGGDMATIVNLCEQYGAGELVRRLSPLKTISEDDAEQVFSTVHKAKGREWASVGLADDLRAGLEEEVNLLYVAVTRAVQHLDPTASLPVLDAMAAKAISLSPEATQDRSPQMTERRARDLRILAAKRHKASGGSLVLVHGQSQEDPAPGPFLDSRSEEAADGGLATADAMADGRAF